MQWWTPSSGIELGLLGLAFVLCACIGFERHVRQKAAGFRTHVLVGTGSAGFTLVSSYGFAHVLGDDVVMDPSRIAAQIVTGIGFLGAGVIFTRKDAVRGLTTAATIWVSAAVGMAAGAGMASLAIGLTAMHLFALVVLGPLVAKIPTRDTNRVLMVTYTDGDGFRRFHPVDPQDGGLRSGGACCAFQGQSSPQRPGSSPARSRRHPVYPRSARFR